MSRDENMIFGGEASRELWNEINALDATSTGDDIRDCIYSVCCKMQELEHKFESQIKALDK